MTKARLSVWVKMLEWSVIAVTQIWTTHSCYTFAEVSFVLKNCCQPHESDLTRLAMLAKWQHLEQSNPVTIPVQDLFWQWKICCLYVCSSGESRIIFLPERCSIYQYRPKISAIIAKKQSRTRLLFAHPLLYILKTQKIYRAFWKYPFQNQAKSVIG